MPTKRFLSSLMVLIVAAAARSYGAAPEALFDGKSLAGWEQTGKTWRVEDGLLVGEADGAAAHAKDTQLIWQRSLVKDFELTFEFKVSRNRAGVIFCGQRASSKSPNVIGYQADLGAPGKRTGSLSREGEIGLVAGLGTCVNVGWGNSSRTFLNYVGVEEELRSVIHEGDWNQGHLVVYGNHVLLKINGHLTAEFFEDEPGLLHNGSIALSMPQDQPGRVVFRQLQLRPLGPGDKKRVVFLAGTPSHGYGAHEHRAGCLLLAKSLNESGLDVIASVKGGQNSTSRWPMSEAEMADVDAVVMYCDGNGGHIAAGHREELQKLVHRKVGISCLHYAVEVDKDPLGATFLDWIGGYFENGWSVNPHWTPRFLALPDHPAAKGVVTGAVKDEWYYHMRFRPTSENLTTLLAAVPPLETLKIKPAHSRSTNPDVLAAVTRGEPQTVAWTYLRPDGGRGFGFTGGHFHENWRDEGLRKLVLNAVLWTAHLDVPDKGVVSPPVSEAFLSLNQDFLKPEL